MALRLPQLKKLFKKNCIRGKFRFESSFTLFEIDGDEFMEDRKDKGKSLKESKKKHDEEHEHHHHHHAHSFWDPLTAYDIWPPFVRCMMTILNEHEN